MSAQPGAPSPVGVPACSAEGLPDSDGDGLADVCELALARTFAPLLVVRAGSCLPDDTQPALPGGGWFHAVQPVGAGIRIAYLPAYFRDCGWRGPKCLLPFVDCGPHDGDSEAIVLDLERADAATDAAWRVAGVFLSAHCFGRSSESCRWYRGAALHSFEWVGSAPVVWVAEGRHANYPSWQACEAGHRGIDTCRRHDARAWFPVDAARNIGSRSRPASERGCVRGSELGAVAADTAAVECFFDDAAPFRGWQRGARGVTPYDRYLREIAEI